MGKHKKLPAATPVEAPPSVPTVSSNLDMAEQAARKAIGSLEAALDGGDSSPQTAREIGSLSRALVTIESERRAQQKAREYTARNLPPEVFFEKLRLMSADDRAHVRRELDALDNTESVLG